MKLAAEMRTGLALAAIVCGLAVTVRGEGAKRKDEAGSQIAAKTKVKTAPKAAGRMAVEKYKLANGLEVILAEDHRLPVTAVNVWYHVGPANEEPGLTGFAHLFEHMMFQGTKHVPPTVHDRLLEQAGGTNMNATTDYDRTNYFETVPSNQLELVLWLESDRMGYLIERLDQKNLSNQQAVVRNERRQTTENRPYGIVEDAMYGGLFPAAHPYHAAVIGSHADIQSAKLADVQKFFRLYYAPNNASLAVAGDFDKAQAKALVDKYFGTLKRGADVPRDLKARVQTPPVTAERRVNIKDRVELERVDMGWITPAIYEAGDAEAALAARVLGGGKASRLYKSLVYEKQIAQEVYAYYQGLTLGSVLQIQATARPPHKAAEVERAIDEVLDRFRREGPTADELEGARNATESRIMTRLETLNGYADRLNYYNHYLGRPDYLQEDLARYRKTTQGSVRAFAEEQLTANKRIVITTVPGTPELAPDVPTPANGANSAAGGGESVNADEPWRNQIPKAAAARALALSAPQVFKLKNGLTVILAARSGMPMLAARLVVKAGSDADPRKEPGLASFAAAMLDEGTEHRNAMAIAEQVDRLGATLDTESTMDATYANVRSLKKNFPAALAILSDVVLHPNFPPEEVERERAKRVAMLLQQRSNAAQVADRVVAAVLYGPRHPYGSPEMGTEASVKAMERDEMAGFWKRNFVPNRAALVVAGDISAAELKTLAEKEFGAWKEGEESFAELGAPEDTARKIVVVDKPGAGQTQLRVGIVGAARATPDYAALEVMNATLGGEFTSRINMNLREEKGYTYGAHSSFAYRRAAGPFLVRAGVRTDATAPSVTEIFKEVARITAEPVSGDELNMSRDALSLSLPGRFETTFQTVNSFANVFIYDLGADYYSRLPGMLREVSAEKVETVAKKYLVPGKMVVVAVGDRARIEPELSKLGLGAIEVRDAEGSVKGQ